MKNKREIIEGVRARPATVPLRLIVADDQHPPRTHSAFEPVAVSAMSESRLTLRCRVVNPSAREGFVVFSRPWYSGYRATLGGGAVKDGRR